MQNICKFKFSNVSGNMTKEMNNVTEGVGNVKSPSRADLQNFNDVDPSNILFFIFI